MKLIFAIVNNDDAPLVSSNLSREGFQATKIASTGGFLLKGNTTFMIGVEDDAEEKLITLISKYSKKRRQTAPVEFAYNQSIMNSVPVEVTVGGATIFVCNVERFERV